MDRQTDGILKTGLTDGLTNMLTIVAAGSGMLIYAL